MDVNVVKIKLDEIHVKCFEAGPELMLYISLFNRKGKRIGQIYMSSQKHYSDTQYKIREETKQALFQLIESLNIDVTENYVSLDSAS